MKAGLQNQRGASATEFAIVLPVLIIILFGIIEFGLLLYNKQVITNASREGARAGIVSRSPRLACTGEGSITSIIEKYCAGHLITFVVPSPDPEISCGADYSSGASFGDELSVKTTYQYSFLLLPNFIKSLTPSLNLSAVTVMKYE